jgi:hypothetical protein
MMGMTVGSMASRRCLINARECAHAMQSHGMAYFARGVTFYIGVQSDHEHAEG